MIHTQRVIFLIFFSLISPCCISFYDDQVFHTQPVPIVPSEINIINWKLVILQALQDVFFFDNIKDNSILLVNIIKNSTNGNIQTNKITNLLINCILENTKKYKVICIEQLYFAYRALGVFPEDHINSYSFSINIANYLQANYVLYGIVYGDVECPILELQLILVKTGEIICVVNKKSV